MTNEKSKAVVLFIDDDEDFAFALIKILEGEGYHVHHAANGEIGVRMAGEERPDLIILDYMMPVMNGFEALMELRKIEGMENVPVVALTSFGQNVGEIYGLREGDKNPLVQDCLEKPVEPNMFLDRIASALALAAV